MTSKLITEGKTLVLVRNVDGSHSLLPAPKPQVLEEDIYTQHIEQIVQKDYFPDLPKLRAQYQWLDAIRRQDLVSMMAIKTHYDQSEKTHSEVSSPLQLTTGDFLATPEPLVDSYSLITPQPATSPSINPTTLSLDEFVVKYTSEDDDSFSKLIQKESTHAKQCLYALHGSSYVPSALNALSNPPAGTGIGYSSNQFIARCEKTISKKNTRYNDDSNDFDVIKQKNDDCLNPKSPCTSANTYETSTQDTQYPFVSMPSPNPHTMPFSPILTWGRLETPLLLDEMPSILTSHTYASPLVSPSVTSGFHVPPTSKHQIIANTLTHRAIANSKRLLRNTLTSPRLTTSPRYHPFPSPRLNLSSKNLRIPFTLGIDTQLRASYTPKLNSLVTPLSTPR